MADLIPKKDLDNLKEQLNRMPKDKDRIRLVTAAADGFKFNCAQVKTLVDIQHFGDAKNQTAILLHPKIVDQENFENVVLSQYKFDEDKKEIRTAVGL